MDDPAQAEDRINSFALVGYIPGALGEFITELRRELVSDCVAQSHVTILPPRPLSADPESAVQDLRVRVAEFSPFEIEMPHIRVFEQSSVVFAEVQRGRSDLHELHDAFNTGVLHFDEPWHYHPHVTLAQGLPPEAVCEVYELARRRWTESAPTHSCIIDRLTFVQNTAANRWLDLEDYELRGVRI
ncbi:MAG TPA: 2'-5' RNA ligase family protein [Bryobacteraceae bacterium]|nr:2'-5' RNA ligase family protein [Bryobacteraceae bacterium]